MLTLTRSPSIQYTHLTYEVSFRITYHLQLNCRRFFTITLQFYILSTHRLHTRLSAPPRRLFFRCEATTLNFQNICVICYLFKEKDVCHLKYVVTSVLATKRWPQLIFPPSASGGAALVCKISGIWLHPDYVKLRQNSGGRYQFLIQFVHSCWLSGHLVSEYWWECHHVISPHSSHLDLSITTMHCTVAHWPTTENHCHVELFEGDLILDSKCGENLCNVSIETIYLIVFFLLRHRVI